MDGQRFFEVFQAIRLHFFSDYNIFKYNGKVPNAARSYEGRKDKYRYESVAKNFKDAKIAGKVCLANALMGKEFWIFDSFDEGMEIYEQWRKIHVAIDYKFKLDLEYLTSILSSGKVQFWDDFLIKTKKGNNPPLLQIYMADKVCHETMIYLNMYKPFIDGWDKTLSTDPLIGTKLRILNKYTPFMNVKPEDEIRHNEMIKETVISNELF
jgi:hypothetical protein